jgi:hypothetical protein
MVTTDTAADPPDDGSDSGPDSDSDSDSVAELVREMRAEVEAAAGQLDALTAAVHVWQRRVDELESVVDAMLRLSDQAIVVVDGDMRMVGLSAAGMAVLGRDAGARLPAPAPSAVACLVDEWQRQGRPEAELTIDGRSARMVALAGGGALVALTGP